MRPAGRLAMLVSAVALMAGVVVLAPTAPASAVGSRPGTLTVRTVPALAGVSLWVEGRLIVTGPGGQVAVWVSDTAGVPASVRLATNWLAGVGALTLARAQAGVGSAGRQLLSVGLNVASPVNVSVDPGTVPEAVASVRSLHLSSSIGEHLDLDPHSGGVVVMTSRRVHLVQDELVAQPVTWLVSSVGSGSGLAIRSASGPFDPYGHPQWQVPLQPVPGTVMVQTVPSTPGVRFEMDGSAAVTGADGSVELAAADLNDPARRLRLLTGPAGETEVSLARVAAVPGAGAFRRRLVAALEVRRTITFDFLDRRGQPIDPGRITRIELRGDGRIVTLTGGQISRPVRLTSQRVTHAGGAWVVRNIAYTLTAVRLDGANAVFSGKQRFEPSGAGTWKVVLAMFSLKVSARDVLFGVRVSSDAWLVRPDGTRAAVRLRGDSPTLVTALVRGSYRLQVGSALTGSDSRVLVSRDGTVEARVLTAFDVVLLIGLVGVVGGTVALWEHRRRRRAARRAATGG